MTKGRLEAFSDAVIAIIMTIMVLELHPPKEATVFGLREEAHVLVGYAFSFLILAIYWNNHHHMIQSVHKVNGKVLWANMHLLFWISFFPFCSAWVGQAKFTSGPMMAYGITMFCSSIAYYILAHALVEANGRNSAFARRLGRDYKGRASILLAGGSAVAAYWVPWLSGILLLLIAIMWFVPDRRFEDVTAEEVRSLYEKFHGG